MPKKAVTNRACGTFFGVVLVVASCALTLAVISRFGCFVIEEKVEGITHESGQCHVYLPKLSDSGWKYLFTSVPDDVHRPASSALDIYENGKLMGPAHASHESIVNDGHGRFSHWRNYVYFSSSDNTNPRSNSRVYTVRYPVIAKLRVIALLSLAVLGLLFKISY